MKVDNITESLKPKLVGGTLPDIDQDLCGRDRAAIKSYIEERFGETQVCSIGTFTTFRVKGLVKDLARISSVDFSEANLMTAIISQGDSSMLDLIKRATLEPKLKNFIKQNSEIFHMLPSLLDQPKTESIHPCAMVVFPDVLTAKEWVPMRRQQGLLVSEWGGEDLDDAGFLKEDILGIRQLDKFADILKLIEKSGKVVPNIYNLPQDREVYRYFSNGWNGDVFQMGSAGLTSYTKSLKPQVIDDLIAAVALYRPGPMENHFHEIYVKCKNGNRSPKYLWGTEHITKDTYGLLIYQEQIMQIFQDLGGLSMKEADDVRRALGKKKLDVLQQWEGIVKKGFIERGATDKEFQEIWAAIAEFAKYSFNKSHSAAYALTGYVSQYLKVHYPIEYWTVALDYANEADTLSYLSEILQSKQIEIKSPDINKSGINMISNQETSTIYWGLGSVKGIGEDTAFQVINEREANGFYLSFADFYSRHNFKGSKVKKTTFEALITSGAFDILYGFSGQEQKRHSLIKRYRIHAKKKPSNPARDIYTIGELGERWWWNLQQKKLTGLAHIGYEKIAIEKGIESQFCSMSDFTKRQEKGIFRAFGGYVVECRVARSKNGQYARLTIEHNYKLCKILVWSNEFEKFSDQLKGSEKRLVLFDGELKYDGKWSKANQFTLKDSSSLIVL